MNNLRFHQDLLREYPHWFTRSEDHFREIFDIIKEEREIEFKRMRIKITEFINKEKKFISKHFPDKVPERVMKQREYKAMLKAKKLAAAEKEAEEADQS